MKKVVLIALVVFSLVVGGIFALGFVQKVTRDSDAASEGSTSMASEPSGAATTSSPSTDSQKRIAVSEVAQHGATNDCWIVIQNKVYDVTKFLSEHPGGVAAISPYCGKPDATNAFNTQGGEGTHSSTARSMLATYLIGEIAQ